MWISNLLFVLFSIIKLTYQQSCSSNEVLDYKSQTCIAISDCQQGGGYINIDSTKCVGWCDAGQLTDIDNKKCINSNDCHSYIFMSTCTQNCAIGNYIFYQSNNNYCSTNPLQDYLSYQVCDTNQFLDLNNPRFQKDCLDRSLCTGVVIGQEIPLIPMPRIYWICAKDCQNNAQLPYQDSNLSYRTCDSASTCLLSYQQNVCVDKCNSSNEVLDTLFSPNICIPKSSCPVISNDGLTCVRNCQSYGGTIDAGTGKCNLPSSCQFSLFSNSCVNKCDSNTEVIDTTFSPSICIQRDSCPMVSSDGTSCVRTCQSSTEVFDPSSGQCMTLGKCRLISQFQTQCTSTCPAGYYQQSVDISYSLQYQCVKSCPKYYSKVDYKCYNIIPDNMVSNIISISNPSGFELIKISDCPYFISGKSCVQACYRLETVDKRQGTSSPYNCIAKENCFGNNVVNITRNSNSSNECVNTLLTNCKQTFLDDETKCYTCNSSYQLSLDTYTCKQSCDSNEFYNASLNTCKQCSSNCAQCQSAHVCSLCLDTFESIKGRCYSKCQSNQYRDSSDLTCKSCDPSCSTCSSSSNLSCLSCASNLQFSAQNNSCSSCQIGYSPSKDQTTCQKCTTSNCSSCSFADATTSTCNVCKSGYYIIENGSNVLCVSSCPSNYTLDANSTKCIQCQSPCLTCAVTATSCSSCVQSYYLNNSNQCLTVCPDGYFKNIDSNSLATCQSCSSGCSKCDSSSNCSLCDSQHYTITDQNNNKTCVQNCSAGTYADATQKTCSGCLSQCSNCSNGSSCSKCNSSYYLYNNSTCNQSCPPQYYPDSSDFTCKACPVNCDNCDNNGTCTSCSTGYNLQGSNCISSCPQGTYNSNSSCANCSANCLQCQDSSVCLTCSDNYFLESGACNQSCSVGKYKNLAKKTCDNCISNCQTCADQLTCSKCSNTNYLLTDSNNNQSCVATCPQGTFTNTQNGSCDACVNNCQVCSNNSTCDVCSNTYYLSNDKTQCLASCPLHHYTNENSKRCQKCDTTCNTCYGVSNSQCLSCYNSTNSSDSKNYFLYENQCLLSCPKTQYGDSNNICQDCFTGCDTCSSSTSCDVCSSTLTKYTDSKGVDSCVSSCPQSYYVSTTPNKICTKCSVNCDTCTDANTCTSCSSGYLQDNGGCVSICPDGQFTSNNVDCENCSTNCKQCTSSSQCKVCNTNYFLDGNVCVQNCSTGKYKKLSDSTCDTCLSNCQACNDKLTCSQCSNTYYLYTDKNNNQSCVSSCPQGTFANSQNGSCDSCVSNCQQCSNNTTCDVCLDTFYLSTDNSSCSNSCNSHEFANATNKKCQQCHPTCNSCTGDQNTQCASCYQSSTPPDSNSPYNNYFLYQNSCIQSCPTSTYGDSNKVCQNCLSNCDTCSSSSKCDNCSTNFQILTNDANGVDSCESSCPLKYYVDTTSPKTCRKCIASCDVCADNLTCNTCSTGFVLYGNNQCLSSCPDGYFAKNSACVSCSSDCKQCDSDSQCNACNDSFFLDDKVCVKTCSAGKFQNLSSKTCDSCLKNCSTCSDGSTCQTCSNTFYLYKDSQNIQSCVSSCPLTTFANSQSGTCDACISNCSTCSDNSTCSSCSNSFYLSNDSSSCLSSCPTHHYTNSTSMKCEKCDSTCNTCSGTSNNQCLTCYSLTNPPDSNSSDNYYFLYSNQCLKNCPAAMFGDASNVCQNCLTGCGTCKSQSTCDNCSSPLIRLTDNSSNDSCVTECPQAYYVKTTPVQQCDKCIDNCQQCSDNLSCNACASGYYIDSNTCSPCSKKFGSNCLSCTTSDKPSDSSVCLSCNLGFSFSNDTQLCEPIATFTLDLDNTTNVYMLKKSVDSNLVITQAKVCVVYNGQTSCPASTTNDKSLIVNYTQQTFSSLSNSMMTIIPQPLSIYVVLTITNYGSKTYTLSILATSTPLMTTYKDIFDILFGTNKLYDSLMVSSSAQILPQIYNLELKINASAQCTADNIATICQKYDSQATCQTPNCICSDNYDGTDCTIGITSFKSYAKLLNDLLGYYSTTQDANQLRVQVSPSMIVSADDFLSQSQALLTVTISPSYKYATKLQASTNAKTLLSRAISMKATASSVDVAENQGKLTTAIQNLVQLKQQNSEEFTSNSATMQIIIQNSSTGYLSCNQSIDVNNNLTQSNLFSSSSADMTCGSSSTKNIASASAVNDKTVSVISSMDMLTSPKLKMSYTFTSEQSQQRFLQSSSSSSITNKATFAIDNLKQKQYQLIACVTLDSTTNKYVSAKDRVIDLMNQSIICTYSDNVSLVMDTDCLYVDKSLCGSNGDNSGLATYIIVLIVLGVCLIAAAVIYLVYFAIKRSKAKLRQQYQDQENHDNNTMRIMTELQDHSHDKNDQL